MQVVHLLILRLVRAGGLHWELFKSLLHVHKVVGQNLGHDIWATSGIWFTSDILFTSDIWFISAFFFIDILELLPFTIVCALSDAERLLLFCEDEFM